MIYTNDSKVTQSPLPTLVEKASRRHSCGVGLPVASPATNQRVHVRTLVANMTQKISQERLTVMVLYDEKAQSYIPSASCE